MPLLLSINCRWGNLQSCESPHDLATHLDAAFHAAEELRVAVALFLANSRFEAGVIRRTLASLGPFLGGNLAGLTGALPGLPVGPLQLVHLGQLGGLLGVEIGQRRLLPASLEGLQVIADLLPADVQSQGDLRLR